MYGEPLITSFESMAEVLAYRAEATPSTLAYGFLSDDLNMHRSFTYHELHQSAAQWATLIEGVAPPGARVMISLPSGAEFLAAFFGCLYARVIAVPAHPYTKRTAARFAGIATHSKPAAVITSPESGAVLQNSLETLGLAPSVLTPRLEAPGAAPSHFPRGCDPAFLQYTSGSISEPRGIRISHANVMSNQRLIQQCFGHDETSRVLSWLPMQHDMGLIGTVLQPLYLGVPGLFMTPAQFASSPISWLRAISRYRITTSGGPNSAYDLCIERDKEAPDPDLDLCCWKVAFSGSEPVDARTLEEFVKQFARTGVRRSSFLPCYGLAEATLFVTGKVWNEEPKTLIASATALERDGLVTPAAHGRTIVSCGRPTSPTQVTIADPSTFSPLPDGVVGEIWVSGPGVADGYFDADDDTRRNFAAMLLNGAGPFLRTGDLGARIDSELYVTGRQKELILLRGRNIHPQDVERVARDVPGIAAGASVAFLDQTSASQGVGVIIEIRRTAKRNGYDIARELARLVANSQDVAVTRVIAVAPGKLPRTTSGKLQRGRAKRMLNEGLLKPLAVWPDFTRGDRPPTDTAGSQGLPDDERRERFYEIIASVTGVPIGNLHPQDSLLGLGIDSLALLKVRTALEHELGLSLPLELLFENLSLAELNTRIRQLTDSLTRP